MTVTECCLTCACLPYPSLSCPALQPEHHPREMFATNDEHFEPPACLYDKAKVTAGPGQHAGMLRATSLSRHARVRMHMHMRP